MEVLIYVTLFAMIFAFVVSVLLSMSTAHIEAQRFRSVTSAANVSMERMVREIRDADEIVVNESTFDQSPGALKVQKTDADGVITETTFFLTASSSLVMSQATSTEGGAGGGGSGHLHDSCTTNSDCSNDYPVCCVVPVHGPDPVCEDPSMHGGICGNGIPDESEVSPLVPHKVEVSNLIFRHIVGTSTEGVRIEVEHQNRTDKRVITENFYNTVILRGSYD